MIKREEARDAPALSRLDSAARHLAGVVIPIVQAARELGVSRQLLHAIPGESWASQPDGRAVGQVVRPTMPITGLRFSASLESRSQIADRIAHIPTRYACCASTAAFIRTVGPRARGYYFHGFMTGTRAFS